MTEPRPLTLETPAEHPFAEFVRILGKGKRGARGLTREEARTAMTLLLEGKVEDAQLGAFLMLLRHKEESTGSDEISGDEHSGVKPAKTFASAAWGVALADVSMSLDNVLAVAGAAREHPYVLVFGLILSVLLMGAAANLIARYIDRYRWIGWVGLVVILWVACKMIYEGAGDVAPVLAPLFT